MVLRRVEWRAIGAVLRQVELSYLAIGWLLSAPFLGGLALRWQIFLRQQEIELPFATTLSLTWGGQFFNSFMPGSTGGDLVKIYQLCRIAPQRKAVAAASVIADRISALIALLTLATVALMIDPTPLRLLPAGLWSTNALLAGFVVSLLALLMMLWLARRLELLARVTRLLAACKEALAFNSRLALAFALGLAVHVLNFSSIYLFARGLGISVSYGQVLLMMPVILFFLLLPVTVNGHGLREVLLIGYLSYFGVRLHGQLVTQYSELAVALSVLIVANDLCWSLPGGIWYFYRFGRGAET